MKRNSEWLVLLTVALAMFVGAITKQKAIQQLQSVSWQKNQIELPGHWKITSQQPDLFLATDLDQGPFGPRVTIRRMPLIELSPSGGGLWIAANSWAMKQTKQFSDHRILSMSEISVHEHKGMKLDCVYLQDVGPNLTPSLMRSTEIVIPMSNQVYVWIFAAEEHSFSDFAKLQNRLLDRWHFE